MAQSTPQFATKQFPEDATKGQSITEAIAAWQNGWLGCYELMQMLPVPKKIDLQTGEIETEFLAVFRLLDQGKTVSAKQ